MVSPTLFKDVFSTGILKAATKKSAGLNDLSTLNEA
jgi:hypothetical protein